MKAAKPSSLAKVWTTSFSRGHLKEVEVQVLIRSGLPRFDIIGLPQNMIREGKDRIYAALSALGVELPAQKLLVNLVPAHLPKEGSHFDFPILVGILKCLGLLPQHLERKFYWGELQLDGGIREPEDCIAHLLFANQRQAEQLIVSKNFALLDKLNRYLGTPLQGFQHISELLTHPTPQSPPPRSSDRWQQIEKRVFDHWLQKPPEKNIWNQLKGSPEQFEFWAISAIGRHHILLEGSPGVGKTSWSQALKEVSLPLMPSHWAEVYRFRSRQNHIIDLLQLSEPPFQAPHHSASAAAIIGGGSGKVLAGALTRAHKGILFLDELPEYSRDVLEALREPLEGKTITIARQNQMECLPADVQLVAAMNPCPCGNYESKKLCLCRPSQLMNYQSKISEPLRDRFHWKLWWRYRNQKRAHVYDLKRIRQRVFEALQAPEPHLDFEPSGHDLNPRQYSRYLDCLVAWARWHHLSSISKSNLKDFETFAHTLAERGSDEI